MKNNLKIMGLMICAIFIITGCGNNSNDNDYGMDLESDKVLSCNSMKYNIFGHYSSNVIENHLFLAEYDDEETNIISAKEIYTADYSQSGNELTKEDKEELKEGFKTRFCDVRKRLITPDGYEGKKVSCDIKIEENVITVEMVYPKDAIEYAKSKGKLGTLEEVKEKIETDNMPWFYNNYFTCDKSYDKSKFINKEINRTLSLKSNSTFSNLYHLANEINQHQRFYEEVFDEYKVDTNNRITLKSVKDEYSYDDGDYILTYNCAADSEETCNKVTDFVIDSFIERAKDFQVSVTIK